MTSNGVLLLHVADQVATVTLNRPVQRNALSSELLRELRGTMNACEGRDDVSVIVITGADPAFCAGLDLKELGSPGTRLLGSIGTARDQRPLARDQRPLEGAQRRGPFHEVTKPVLGAINGTAITGGLELALACDFLVASERATFADTHARVGIQPAWGLTVRLREAVGIRRAREMSATGNFVDAKTALAWGLVNHVVGHDELLACTLRIAKEIAANDQAAVKRLFKTYDEGSLMTPADAWALEARAAAEWLTQGGGDPGEIATRRDAIITRGSSQVR